MSNDTSTGYASNWNVPNFTGNQLLTFSATEYPFLSRVPGRVTAQAPEFAMSAQYALETFSSTGITEANSVTAPTAVAYERTTEKNYIQIFQKAIQVTYNKLSSNNRLKFSEVSTSGYAYSNDPLRNAIDNELRFQVARAQEQAYGDLETAMMTGTQQLSTSASVAMQTGGIIPLCTTNTVAASSAQLSKDLINELLRTMAATGSKFRRPVIFCNAYQKQKLSDIYAYVPMARNDGGANIQVIETDFGRMEVVYSRFVTTSVLLIADMAYVNLVNQPVPGKSYLPDGLFLLEELARTGAGEKWQLYGQLGLDLGAQKLHGTITGLATS